MTANRSARGKANRAKGATAERDLAKWLRPWYADARRAVFNGWVSKDTRAADPGDIDCAGPGLYWSVKNTQVERIFPWMAELDAKSAGRVGLLVVRRKGRASPGEWWCWLRLGHLYGLWKDVPGWAPESPLNAPVRMELQHVMPLLVAANYAPAPRLVA